MQRTDLIVFLEGVCGVFSALGAVGEIITLNDRMEPIDKNYLRLQFWDKIHRKNATEFQLFFEDIMEKAFPDFGRIRAYGKEGDAGNDGYRPTKGIYYQVYAPRNPNQKEAKAAQKLREDFEKLKKGWNQISKIRTFYFVFNDKGAGVSIEIERALAELRNNNQDIKFKKLIPKDLERIFFELSKQDILALGFDVDSTNALRITRESLEKLEVELDRESMKFVLKAVENLKDIVPSLRDETLDLDYEILEARVLSKLEKKEGAKEKYESLCKRYPGDPRSFLYLAEIYLNNEDFEENERFLKQAEGIDSGHWLLKLMKLVREYRLNNQLDATKIDERNFPKDPRVKSNFYRLYSLFLEQSGDQIGADSFIERAIHLNPDKIHNYHAQLSILESRIFSQTADREKLQKDAEGMLTEIEVVEQKAAEWGELSPRNQAILNFRKLSVFRVQNNLSEIERLAKENLELQMQCCFDQTIDQLFAELLIFIELPPKDFERLLHYLEGAEKAISDDLAKAIISQFNLKKNLITRGKTFFEATKKKPFLDLINDLENKRYEEVWLFLKEDPRFAVAMASTAKEFPDLRRKIIKNLPGDTSIQKEKLLLLLNYDENNIDEAFNLLKELNLSNLSYLECKPILEIAQQMKAWDFVIQILEKLLQYEKHPQVVLQLKLQLFTANLNLQSFLEVIRIGEGILSNSHEVVFLDTKNKEVLLGQTLGARLKRGQYLEAKMLMEKHLDFSNTFEFKIGVEAEVYLKNNEARKALKSVVAGVKIIKKPTPEQYGSLFVLFVGIGNLIDFLPIPLKKVEANCYVKLEEQGRWYFIGDDDELDATKISSTNEKYSKFLDKRIEEKVVLDSKYRSNKIEYTVESILFVDKYILWQCMYHAKRLSLEDRWDMMEIIEVPRTGETIDTKHVIAYLEDKGKKRGDFFALYCRENIPLAALAVSEGGLTNAIGRVINENKGFIEFSSSGLAEINEQKEIAKRIIADQPFYIDGTSALVLSETGLLEKVYEHLPNLKVPRSVITLLLETEENFRYMPGKVGHMGYAQGKLTVSPIDREKEVAIQRNFEKCINLLESKPQNIVAISSANKSDCFSEQIVPPALCDACVLAQEYNVPVITEDFLYLKVNEFETKKKAPEYCSAFALIRVLYERKEITFDQYLTFFYYLSSHRFRFLPISTDDIEKAVFGDGTIKTVHPENIRQFNLPLTLSREYGVPFDTAFFVMVRFLLGVLIDDAILPVMTERIFAEIVAAFPADKNKIVLGQMFLRVSLQRIRRISQRGTITRRIREKIDLLSQSTGIYGPTNILWTP